MAEITTRDASNQALHEELERDEKIIPHAEDVVVRVRELFLGPLKGLTQFRFSL